MPTPTFYIVCLATIVSLIFYNKVKNTKYVYFVYYLVFAFIIELIAFLFAKIYIISTNSIYNIYTITTFIFYFIFYWSLFKKKKNKKIMQIILIMYFILSLFDILYLKSHFVNDFFANNIVFGSILLLITLILFLIEIINDENLIFNIKKSLIFWISIGALLLYIGVIPIIIAAKHLGFKGIYDTILTTLNIIMYGSFTIGFIWSDPKYNY